MGPLGWAGFFFLPLRLPVGSFAGYSICCSISISGIFLKIIRVQLDFSIYTFLREFFDFFQKLLIIVVFGLPLSCAKFS